jgi:uncharacterized protein YceK
MRTLTILLAAALVAGCGTLASDGVSRADGRVRYATEAEWAACVAQVQAQLAPQWLVLGAMVSTALRQSPSHRRSSG